MGAGWAVGVIPGRAGAASGTALDAVTGHDRDITAAVNILVQYFSNSDRKSFSFEEISSNPSGLRLTIVTT
jgi:hypothetical protein